MSHQKNRRSKLFIEPRMQGLLLCKVLLYWINGFLTIGLLIAAWSVFQQMPRTSGELLLNVWNSVGPALFASVFLMPLILMDCVRWSNRYAGPMVRLHEALRDLADGKQVAPVKFRKGDLWFEMAEQFNRISARTHQASAANLEAKAIEATNVECSEELEAVAV